MMGNVPAALRLKEEREVWKSPSSMLRMTNLQIRVKHFGKERNEKLRLAKVER